MKFFVANSRSIKTAIKIALLYFILGEIWIIFSDLTVSSLDLEESTLSFVNIIKGLLFVLVSAIIFFYFLKNFSIEPKDISQNGIQRKIFRRDWFDPVIILSLLVIVVGLGFWMLYLKVSHKEETRLKSDAIITKESIAFRLNGTEQFLKLLANERIVGDLDLSSFEERTHQYIEDHKELINITWVDSNFVIKSVSPLESNKQILGLTLSLPEPSIASKQAKEIRESVYTNPFEAIQGGSSFEIWVPVYDDSLFLGLFAGVYSCQRLIDYVLPAQIENNYHVSLMSQENSLLSETELLKDVDKRLTHIVRLDPPGNGIQLKLSRYNFSLFGWEIYPLILLVIILFIALVYNIITSRKNIRYTKLTETALESSESKFSNLFQTMHQGVVYQDTDGNIVDANPASLKMLGLTVDNIKGRTSIDPRWKAVHEDGSDFPGETHPAMISLKTGKMVKDVTMGIFNPQSNTYRWLLVSATPLFDNSSEIPIGVFTSFSDITELKNTSNALLESELRYKTFINNSLDAILLTSPDGRIYSANPAACKLFDMTEAEIINKGRDGVVDVTDPNLPILLEERKIKGKASGELYFIKKDGSKFLGEVTSALFKLSTGDTRTSMIIRDITKRKEAEQKIIESEIRFHSTLDSMIEGCQILDFNWVYQYLNDSADLHNKRPKEELLGRKYTDCWPGIENTHVYNVIKDTLENRTPHQLENEFTFPDGTVGYFQLSIQPVPEGVFILSMDITHKKETETYLRKLSQAVEQSPASVVITDTDGNIDYVNNKFCSKTGYDKEEVIGKNPRFLKSGHHPREFYENLWNTILSGRDWFGEMLNKKKNGDLYWVSERISPIINDKGKITHFVSIKEDITEKKKMVEELIIAKDKAEKSEKLKTDFLAQVSHEIRTPMNAIIGFNSLLSEDTNEENQDIFDGIHAASKRIIRTIDLILNTSEVQLGTFTASFTDVNLATDIFHEMKNEFLSQAKNKGLALNFVNNLQDSIIWADRYSIGQIFVNLIDNAIKYTDKGSVDIILETNHENNLRVCVKDTGIGISEEFLSQIFEPFTQEDTGYSRRYEGNGLGLALVKKYCDINNCTLTIESRKGVGSNFIVTFPLSNQ
jgi:PAS domain S-box-containing protein